MYPVWEAIEESGLPVAHHIGEAPLASPCRGQQRPRRDGAQRGAVPRDVRPLRVRRDPRPPPRPAASAGSRAASTGSRPRSRTPSTSTPRCSTWPTTRSSTTSPHYWHDHMYASFMVDPLGLELIDRIGVDRVMWSSDYPHNESTFGYSEQSLASVVEAVGPEAAVKIVSTNVQDVPRPRRADERAHAWRRAGLDLPAQPDLARMRRERGEPAPIGDGRQGHRRADPARQQPTCRTPPGRAGR